MHAQKGVQNGMKLRPIRVLHSDQVSDAGCHLARVAEAFPNEEGRDPPKPARSSQVAGGCDTMEFLRLAAKL
jgi:hypothetical protein